MKANFKELNVEVRFGEFEPMDVTKVLGNYLHANTSDIGLDDVARAIYYSDGEIEIVEDMAQAIVTMVKQNRCPLVAAIKRAVIEMLSE